MVETDYYYYQVLKKWVKLSSNGKLLTLQHQQTKKVGLLARSKNSKINELREVFDLNTLY